MPNGTGEILTMLRDAGPLSRAELSRLTGLSSAGVTKLTAQLDAAGLVASAPEQQGKALGRPATALALRPGARSVLAVDIGAGRVHAALSDLGMTIRGEQSFSFDLGAPVDTVLSRCIEMAREVIAASGLPMKRLLGVGIGVPGGVDAAGRVNTNSTYAGWSDVPVADAFEEALGLPATLEHNATAIAMAAAFYGDGEGAESLLYVLLGKGIGGGFAERGTSGGRRPVEIGHIVVEPGGRRCRCGGEGCLEMYFSEQPLRKVLGGSSADAGDLLAAAMQTADWPRIYEHLLSALSTSVTLLAPERLVLGGSLAKAPAAFLEALRRDLPPRVMPQHRRALTIEVSRLHDPVGLRGAASVALDRFFYRNGPAAAPSLR